ncbi:hypothetical protein MPTK1_2g03090 [Marchantia polymorpha subsp. ruderalis]|uniref:Uncharacterized protein n=1 Tax=Marchantia polymorpha TaxID=3197 RepID=A0A2R6WM88_MARPO|nr:hypothetical protein MARPO_0075s0070 [Marchantia polymorpha]BBN00919.1 hypothetical protein Mp_2g03090 [Marchantia polymorpha subsp. ruderalis]|eukprot:PTQ34973.1 hypothetical protein MARPO_0075s0070 [Marchantia polymorpha]
MSGCSQSRMHQRLICVMLLICCHSYLSGQWREDQLPQTDRHIEISRTIHSGTYTSFQFMFKAALCHHVRDHPHVFISWEPFLSSAHDLSPHGKTRVDMWRTDCITNVVFESV